MIKDAELLNAKILVVDDKRANVLLLENILKQGGYKNIKSTTDSKQAEKLYADFRPDLVLLDLRMPPPDGFEVMERIKRLEANSYPPILILTAEPAHEIRLRALQGGARDFLTKPLDMLEVTSRIKNMLETRLLYNQVLDHNANLEEKVRERTLELHKTRLEVINRLGLAAEYRDNETGQHVIRMSHFCRAVGKALALDNQNCELLFLAAPMHDVGKIGIRDNILLKPAGFDNEEWEIMKTHAQIGARILSGSDSNLLKLAESIALTHHEKWDGTGYPRGLKGEEIPMEGRITAVCDVFDALTSIRPYKRAWSVEDAMREIESKSGSHFDPELVKTFKSILPEITRIKTQYSETLKKTNGVPMTAEEKTTAGLKTVHA